eukprot:CAMPEP_0197263968 /NCGR_PEP_ID=MMETSP1432-20130617/1505_1 /TAXON_ID=44447 /ORGANISM="Pseudo-nitzschia delicatissima, Strain UNC1205" /LENGTH=172 /DNA_ID=CAMNT_0042728549 /DNA_START=42 /DNA_END=559 /DNA_ORIENTATION=-
METQAGSPGLMCPLDASYSQSSSSFGIDTPKDTAAGSMAAEDGEFEMMQDDDEDGDEVSAMELTDRVVKWINRQNVVRIEDYPFGSLLAEGNRQTSDPKGARSDCGDCFCDDHEGESSGLFWECMPQTQERAIELCSTKDVLEDNDAPIVASDSNDTFNSVIIRDARRAATD